MAVENANLIPTFDNIEWVEPKIDWKSSDKFNKEDYNRIKNNIDYLQHIYSELNNNYEETDLGEDIIDYTSKYKASSFNRFEQTLSALDTYNLKFGSPKTFTSNGLFIDYEELNRIESLCMKLYELMNNQYIGRRTLPFVLGISAQNNFFNL